MSEWKKHSGLVSLIVISLLCFAAIFFFHVRSRDVQQALDRPLPVIKDVDPNAIEIKTVPAAQPSQSTPSASSEETKP